MDALSLANPLFVPATVFLAVAAFTYALTLPRGTVLDSQFRTSPAASVDRPPPLPRRLLSIFFGRFGQSARTFSSPKKAQETQQRLTQAGNPIEINQFLAVRLIGTLGPLAVALVLILVRGTPDSKTIAICGVAALLGWRLPDVWLGRAIKARRKRLQRGLPDAFDLIIVCVEAGHSLEAALTIVSRKLGGVLGEELDRMLLEISVGKLRRDALRDMADRLQVQELQTFVAAVNQAEQMGVGIAQVLRTNGEAMRIKRRQTAEEEAAKLPVKMLLPLALFIFPSIMIVIVGPVALTAMATLSGHGVH